MVYCLASISLNFHIPVDFRSNVLLPHILSILHPNRVKISWFSLLIYKSPVMAKKSMRSQTSLVSSILILPQGAKQDFSIFSSFFFPHLFWFRV